MKYIKIALVIIIILALLFVGYKGYNAYQKWQQTQKSHDQLLMESLKANEGMIIRLTTELAEIQKKVIGDTLKETIIIREKAPTYESTKEELIELREDPEVNAEAIEVARIIFEKRIDEFQGSPDKILINTGEKKIVLYEDKEGNLVSLQEGLTITRHRELSENVPILVEEEIAINETRYNLKAGGYYDITEKEYGLILSKGILGIGSYNLNVSLLSNLKDLKGIDLGVNLNYEIKNNLELGVGVTIDQTYFMALQYSF